MLGFGDGWVFAAYILCIISAIICAVYGIINWNKGADETESAEQKHWDEKEIEIEKPL